MGEENLLTKYPSLEVMYESVKDTLNQESQKLSDLSIKATFLWGAITTILGVVIPIVNQVGKIALSSPLLSWILALYGLTTILSWVIIFPKPFYDAVDFDTLWSNFAEKPKEVFWHDMFVYIARVSGKNRIRLSLDAWLIRLISLVTSTQFVLLFYWIWISAT